MRFNKKYLIFDTVQLLWKSNEQKKIQIHKRDNRYAPVVKCVEWKTWNATYVDTEKKPEYRRYR